MSRRRTEIAKYGNAAIKLNGVDRITAFGSAAAGVKAFNPISSPWIIDRTTFIQSLAVDCGLIDCGQSFKLIKNGMWTKWGEHVNK